MTALRKSSRPKRQAESYYDDEKKRMDEEIANPRNTPRKKRKAETDEEGSDDAGSVEPKKKEAKERKKKADKKEEEEKKATKKGVEDDDEDGEDEEEDEEDDDDDDDEEEEALEPSDESEDDDEGDEDYTHGKSARPPKKTTPRKTTPKKIPTKPATPASGSRGGRMTPRKSYTARRTAAPKPRGIQNALAALARKVLEESETVETSLTAQLLSSYKTKTKKQQAQKKDGSTLYTAQLEEVARRVVRQHQEDPNIAQTALLNMIFRSVGGTTETFLEPELVVVENMDSEEWGQAITDLVDDMSRTPIDCVLLCADPDGAPHAATTLSSKRGEVGLGPSSLGVREYRKIYEEFWKVLGAIALTEGVSEKKDDEEKDETDNDEDDEKEKDDDDDDEGEGEDDEDSGGDEDDEEKEKTKDKKKKPTNTSRFDTEMAKELINRVNELVTVGQPDVRAAATIASLNMGLAALKRTVELEEKMEVANRQLKAASSRTKGKTSIKAESLKIQVESIQRVTADLEEIVLGCIIPAVFMHRYRDSNMHIRAFTLNALSEMTLLRPDLFLMDKFLKYFGWMLSDKEACVRMASLSGLVAPFRAVTEKPKDAAQSRLRSKIDINRMENVIAKFQARLADCVIDVSVSVQEKAMALLLMLARNGFLDDVEDDSVWNQINIRALAVDTSPEVRRDALYFVMEQLEAFDDDGGDDEEEDSSKKGAKWSKDKNASLVQSTEKTLSQRLDSLASWVAHTLTDGTVPIDKIRVELADLVVDSLRQMPEHKKLVTDWAVMLRAISTDNIAMTHGRKASDRADVAKQRVLVQMLACAVQQEVGEVASPTFLEGDIDPQTGQTRVEITPAKKTRRGKKKSSEALQHEILSVALLKALPDLLMRFKTDPTILGSITILPRYLLPSVISLAARKNDFKAVTKNLTNTFLESSDDNVLRNVALSLSFLSRDGHVRSQDARLQIKRLVTALFERLIELLSKKPEKDEENDHSDTEEEDDEQTVSKKRKKKSRAHMPASKRRRSSRKSESSKSDSVDDDDDEDDDDDDDDKNKEKDIEYSIFLGLKRLRILAKQIDLAELVTSEGGGNATVTIEAVRNAVVEGIATRLKERQVSCISEGGGDEEDDDQPEYSIPDIWKEHDASVHEVVAKMTKEAMDFLLVSTAWTLRRAQLEDPIISAGLKGDIDVDEDKDLDDHVVVGQRDQVVALLCLCFEQHLPDDHINDDEKFSKTHVAFADSLQLQATQVLGDLRTLFPKAWKDAASPLLRICALTDDQQLLAGFVRYFRTMEDELRDGEPNDEKAKDLLLPFARSLAVNWSNSNRREAGYALAHIVGSGQEASKIVGTLTKIVKKIDPVRLLEAQMACLRTSFEDWLNSEPEEVESQRPTDEEMAEFEEAEKKYQQQLHLMQQQAGRLSQTLGVARLSNAKLKQPLLGFIREGVRYSFTNDTLPGEEPLMVGGRLTFLTLLSKYSNFISRDKEARATILQDLNDGENNLRNDPNFEEVHADDLQALAGFRRALGFKETKLRQPPRRSTPDRSRSISESSGEEGNGDDRSGSRQQDHPATPSSSDGSSRGRKRTAHGSSTGSILSRFSSAHSSLSPLYEEDSMENDSPVHVPRPSPKRKKARTKASHGSGSSPIKEEDDDDEDSLTPRRRKKSSGATPPALSSQSEYSTDDGDLEQEKNSGKSSEQSDSVASLGSKGDDEDNDKGKGVTTEDKSGVDDDSNDDDETRMSEEDE